MLQKDLMLSKGRWPEYDRKILVIMLIDASIDAVATGADTDMRREDAASCTSLTNSSVETEVCSDGFTTTV